MSNDPITIEDVKRLTLEPGDTLVLRVPEGTTAVRAAGIKAGLEASFPDHRTVLLVGDVDLEIVSQPPAKRNPIHWS